MSEANLKVDNEILQVLLNALESKMRDPFPTPDLGAFDRLVRARDKVKEKIEGLKPKERQALKKAPCEAHTKRLTKLTNDLADLKERAADLIDLPGRVEALESAVAEMVSTMENTPMAGTGFARNYQGWQTRVQKAENRLKDVEAALRNHNITAG